MLCSFLATMDSFDDITDEELIAAVDSLNLFPVDSAPSPKDTCNGDIFSMDGITDGELITAVDSATSNALQLSTSNPSYFSSTKPLSFHHLLPCRPTQKQMQLHNYIIDVLPQSRWPDRMVDAFYSPHLRIKERWFMACFFWYNGLNPLIAVEWYGLLGAFSGKKAHRQEEFMNCFKQLNRCVDDHEKRHCLDEWLTFDLERNRYVPMSTQPVPDEIQYTCRPVRPVKVVKKKI